MIDIFNHDLRRKAVAADTAAGDRNVQEFRQRCQPSTPCTTTIYLFIYLFMFTIIVKDSTKAKSGTNRYTIHSALYKSGNTTSF